MALNEFYNPANGEASILIPELGGETTVTQVALSEHPFMWALDSWLFAGPDAQVAAQLYPQAEAVSHLDVQAYRIEDTIEGTLHLRRGM